jgi:ubiquinone biosynthesis protein UbiJ
MEIDYDSVSVRPSTKAEREAQAAMIRRTTAVCLVRSTPDAGDQLTLADIRIDGDIELASRVALALAMLDLVINVSGELSLVPRSRPQARTHTSG